MQKRIYKADQSEKFGTWNDSISKFLYFDSTKEILKKIQIPKNVADYGGANGNIKRIIPNAISIDIDESKKPDILADIITHKKKYDLVIIRFVLHYLNDYQFLQLFDNIKSKKILIIQFINDDLKSKYQNSQNEHKYFRTTKQLEALLPNNYSKIYSKKYEVDENFYINRLGTGYYKKHDEILNAYYYDNSN